MQIKIAPNTKNVLTKWYVTTALAMNQIQIKTIILSDLWSKGTYLSNIALVHKIHWALMGHGSKKPQTPTNKICFGFKKRQKITDTAESTKTLVFMQTAVWLIQ